MTAWVERRRERKARLRFLCKDCGKDTRDGEYYMVCNRVWTAAGMRPHGGMLCLLCLMRRLGRVLQSADFTAVWPERELFQGAVRAYLREERASQLRLPAI